MKTPLLPLVFVGALVTGLSSDNPPATTVAWVDAADPAIKAIRQAGEQQIDRIGHQLVYEMERAVSTQGPAAAISTAHLKDFALSQPGATQPRATAFKLTSLNLRNSANKPDEEDRAALNRINHALYEGDDVPAILVQKIERPDTPVEWRVYRPITTMPLCLKCHSRSETLAPEVRARLDQDYPADSATGYSAYEWRGVVRVSLAVDPTPAPKK